MMVVGEPPSADEEQAGRPFVESAGAMLDRMLEAVLGVKRADVFLTSLTKCHPPDDRGPHADELAACRRILDAQLRLIQPAFVLAMGSFAAQALTGRQRSITSLRGEWTTLPHPGGEARLLVTFDPRHLQQKPGDKGLTFGDLKMLKAELESAG